MTNRRDPYKGRQMYPKDTVTRKQMDRVSDRSEARIDLHRDRLRRLTLDVRVLQSQMTRLLVVHLALAERAQEEE